MSSALTVHLGHPPIAASLMYYTCRLLCITCLLINVPRFRFKPVELTTKLGLTGHIKCPVGTHGLFKVHFGRVIKGMAER